MSWREQAEQHARECHPAESCGLVVRTLDGAEVYWPGRNIAEGDDFQIHPDDLAAPEDLGFEVLAVVHSHTDQDQPQPSQSDLDACDSGDLDWHIVSWPARQWVTVQPVGSLPPLVERTFAYGQADCYSIIRDWYRIERGVWLADVPRTSDTEADGSSIYLPRLQSHGWRVVEGPPRAGDVLLMRMGAREPNHAALYLGADTILHHLEGRLSARELWGADYRARTTHILRHASDPHP